MLKVRLQTQSHDLPRKNMLQMFTHIGKTEGARGLYMGVCVSCQLPSGEGLHSIAALCLDPASTHIQHSPLRYLRRLEAKISSKGSEEPTLPHAVRNVMRRRLHRRHRRHTSRYHERAHAERCRSATREEKKLQARHRWHYEDRKIGRCRCIMEGLAAQLH